MKFSDMRAFRTSGPGLGSVIASSMCMKLLNDSCPLVSRKLIRVFQPMTNGAIVSG